MFLIVYWLTSNIYIWAVFRQGCCCCYFIYGVGQSVSRWKSDIIRQSCLAVSARIRIEHEIVSVLLAVSLNEHNEFTKQCLHSLTPRTHASPMTLEPSHVRKGRQPSLRQLVENKRNRGRRWWQRAFIDTTHGYEKRRPWVGTSGTGKPT